MGVRCGENQEQVSKSLLVECHRMCLILTLRNELWQQVWNTLKEELIRDSVAGFLLEVAYVGILCLACPQI